MKHRFLLSFAFAVIAGAVQAESIFVDQSSAAHWQDQDGSASTPFITITQALDLARKIRFGAPDDSIASSKKAINVHVAPGTYVGSFTGNDRRMERLPLLLNVPHLKLKGALRFNAAGEIVPGTETILRASTQQGTKQHMLVVTRTRPTSGFPQSLEMAGDAVTISGLFFDGSAADGTKAEANGSVLISLDGVTGFVIRENYVTNAGSFGISTRLSSGRIENNLLADNRGVGLNVSGGSETFPARLEIVGNRMRNNRVGGCGLQGAAQTENDRPDLFNAHEFRRVALPQFFDRMRHPQEVPDKLEASVVGNEFSGNGNFGIRVNGYVRDYYTFHPLDPADLSANVLARFVGNVSKSNGNYGVVIDGGQIQKTNARKHVVNIDVSFDSTTLEENGSGPALFGFWRFASSVSAAEESRLDFKFVHDSTMTTCGDVTRFNYENRATDPADQTRTNNVLTVNRVPLRGFCVPLYGCFVELPRISEGCK